LKFRNAWKNPSFLVFSFHVIYLKTIRDKKENRLKEEEDGLAKKINYQHPLEHLPVYLVLQILP
jgi:hypothetical protein